MSKTSRRRAPLIAGVIVAALVAAFAVSPAAAGAPSAAQGAWVLRYGPLRQPEQPRRLVDGARGRSDIREPALNQLAAEVPANQQGRADRNFRVTVPTWVHVVSDGAIGQRLRRRRSTTRSRF